MEKRINQGDIKIKSNVRNLKVIVNESEIKFYFNDNQYVVAYRRDKTIYYEFREEEKLDSENITIKDPCKGMVMLSKITCILLVYSIFWCVFKLPTINALAVVAILWLYCVALKYCSIINNVKSNLNPDIKSKHSAAHKMIRFFQRYNKIPKTIEELNNVSRFIYNCNCKNYYNWHVKYWLLILITILVMKISVILVGLMEIENNILISKSILPIIAVILFLGMRKAIYTSKLFEKIVNIFKTIDGYILQYAITAKDVKKEDLEIAYVAGSIWYTETYRNKNVEVNKNCK